MKYKTLSWFFLFFVILSGCTITNPALSPGQHYAEVSGGKIWYDVLGDGKSTPILMLHGGPGGTSYSLFALHPLSDEYTLILFDQIGTGRSGDLEDTSLMNMDYFVEQLHEFIRDLGLKKYILYGHSWGTMLGLDYYLKYPRGIEAIIMNSPLVSADRWMADADTLIAMLPDSIQEAIHSNEKNETYDSPAYRNANRVYYNHYISRSKKDATPDTLVRIPGNNLMYNTMWGPSEFHATGTLKHYNRLDRLDEVRVPVLWIAGEFDEARPSTVKYYHSLTPGSSFAVIKGAAHGTMHDNQAENVRVIREFLEHLN